MMDYTTIEQSRKLFELGLDSDSASMVWATDMADCFFEYPTMDWRPAKEYIDGKHNLPCWSVSDLFKISKEACKRFEMHLRIDKRWNIFAVVDSGDIFNPCYEKENGEGYASEMEALYDLVYCIISKPKNPRM